MRAFVLTVMLAMPAGAETTWTQVAPLLEPAIEDVFAGTAPGDDVVRGAIAEAVEATLPRVSLACHRSAGSPARLLKDERTAAMLRRAVAHALRERDIACADCAPPEGPSREASLLELLPRILAGTYVGEDDLKAPIAEAPFHACPTMLAAAEIPDDALSNLALATLLAALQDENVLARFRTHVRAARRALPRAGSLGVTERYRLLVGTDPVVLQGFRDALPAECAWAGFRCADEGGAK